MPFLLLLLLSLVNCGGGGGGGGNVAQPPQGAAPPPAQMPPPPTFGLTSRATLSTLSLPSNQLVLGSYDLVPAFPNLAFASQQNHPLYSKSAQQPIGTWQLRSGPCFS